MINDAELLFMGLLAIPRSSFMKFLFKSFARFFNWAASLLSIHRKSLSILDGSPLSEGDIVNTLSWSMVHWFLQKHVFSFFLQTWNKLIHTHEVPGSGDKKAYGECTSPERAAPPSASWQVPYDMKAGIYQFSSCGPPSVQGCSYARGTCKVSRTGVTSTAALLQGRVEWRRPCARVSIQIIPTILNSQQPAHN